MSGKFGLLKLTKYLPNRPDLMLKAMESPHMKYLAIMLDMIVLGFKIANLPLVRRIHPWVQPEKNQMYPIPVNQSLEVGEDVVLPQQIVEKFIDKSTHRVIMDICGCRLAYGCNHYPKDVGCLMMGEDSRFIETPFARSVSKEEAKAHLQKAVAARLPPFIGKANVDNFIFGVPDAGRLFTVCFCCDCCCLGRIYQHMPPNTRNGQMNRLEGLEVWVERDLCNGCGQCADHCFLDLIKIVNKGAFIPDDCRGCGRCADVCPQNAIQMRLNNPDYADQTIRRLERYVTIG